MPAYDYRCGTCGLEFELVHSMKETVERRAHDHADSGDPCDGPLERLISQIGVNLHGRSETAPSDSKLQRLGFTKYVRGSKGYEKAFGKDQAPDQIRRES
jgi:putative FmdB family regulatory protein